MAGIGDAGVEACGEATAVKFKSREWQERLCQCAIAQLRGRPQGSAVIMRTPYALTRPPLVVTRLRFGVYSTRTSRAIKQNSISIANCPDWARRASEPSLRHLKRRDLGAARNVRVTPTLATHPPIAPARATAAFRARHLAQLPLKLRCGIQTTRSRPFSVLRVFSTSRLHSRRMQPSRPPAPQLLSAHAAERT